MSIAVAVARCALAVVCALWLAAGAAHAQTLVPVAWVSGAGDDVNACSRTAPCKTFYGAFQKVQTFGQISCLDPGGFGQLTITRSVTIDCHADYASVQNMGGIGIRIDFDQFSDTSKTVRIRNIDIAGGNGGATGIQIIGQQSNGSAVFIEDCVIDGNYGNPGAGIIDQRNGGGALYVTNTTVRNVGGSGIRIAPDLGSTQIQVTLDNVTVENAGANALEVGAGVTAVVGDSIFAGSNTGILASGSRLDVNASVVHGNATGIQAQFSATVRVSNSDVAFNGTGVSGTIYSYTDSRFSGNGAGGTISQIGSATSASGQK